MPTSEALTGFQQFVTPDDGRKFTERYNRANGSGARWTLGPQGSRAGRRVINGASGKRCDMDGKPGGSIRGNESINVQHLKSSQLDTVSRVCISTIQRLYSTLRSLFFWVRNTDLARRDQRHQTGIALCECHEVH